MNLINIFLSSLGGTALMTGFSYIISSAFRKLFKEPVLLQYVMRLLRIDIGATSRWILGWAIHLFIGFIFAFCYYLLLDYEVLDEDFFSAVIFGAIAGIAGILGWMIIFSLPSERPRVHFREYFAQLFIAHIFFGIGVWLTLQILT